MRLRAKRHCFYSHTGTADHAAKHDRDLMMQQRSRSSLTSTRYVIKPNKYAISPSGSYERSRHERVCVRACTYIECMRESGRWTATELVLRAGRSCQRSSGSTASKREPRTNASTNNHGFTVPAPRATGRLDLLLQICLRKP